MVCDVLLIFSPLRLIITAIVVIILLIILIRFRSTKERSKHSLDILRARRDRGEITSKQFEEARKQQKNK